MIRNVESLAVVKRIALTNEKTLVAFLYLNIKYKAE